MVQYGGRGAGAIAARPRRGDLVRHQSQAMNQTPAAYRTADEIKVIALVGAGSVGKSWAALYLAHGYEVIATDPAPGFEHELRRFVTDAWPVLRRFSPPPPPRPPCNY